MKKLLFVCSIALLLAGCGRKAPSPEESSRAAAEKSLPLVRVCRAEAQHHFVERVFVQGSVRARESAAISARIPGAIDDILVEEGAMVKAGTPLFQIDKVNLSNAVLAAEDDLGVAQAKLEQSLAVLEKAKLDGERMTRLADTGAVTVDARERAVVGASSAEASVKAARAMVTKATTGLQVARKNLEDSMVKAPFDGILTRKLKHKGDFVGAGTPVFLMDSSGGNEVCFSLDSAYYPRVEVGRSLVGSLPISYKSPSVNPATRTFEVRVQLPLESPLASGMLVNDYLVLREFTAPAVPASAVNLRDGQETLFVVVEGEVRAVRLKPGYSEGGFRSLEAGDVPPDALVVADGMLLLNEGDQVTAVTAWDEASMGGGAVQE